MTKLVELIKTTEQVREMDGNPFHTHEVWYTPDGELVAENCLQDYCATNINHDR